MFLLLSTILLFFADCSSGKEERFPCGDQEIKIDSSSNSDGECACGNKTIISWYNDKYDCIATGCIQEGPERVYCQNGKVELEDWAGGKVGLDTDGNCSRIYPWGKDARGYDMWKCDDGSCVRKDHLCIYHLAPLCLDNSDLFYCRNKTVKREDRCDTIDANSYYCLDRFLSDGYGEENKRTIPDTPLSCKKDKNGVQLHPCTGFYPNTCGYKDTCDPKDLPEPGNGSCMDFSSSTCLSKSKAAGCRDMQHFRFGKYFQCNQSDGGEFDGCIHPFLKCDGHIQCPNGADEDLEMCQQMYLNYNGQHYKDINDKSYSWEIPAKYRVQKFPGGNLTCTINSTYYRNITIKAVRCNGHEECENNEDEKGCKSSLVLLSIPILGALFLSIVTVLLALCLQSGSDDVQWKGNDKMHDFNGICQDIYYFITQQAISSQSSLSDVFVNFIEHIYKDDDENKSKFLQKLLNQDVENLGENEKPMYVNSNEMADSVAAILPKSKWITKLKKRFCKGLTFLKRICFMKTMKPNVITIKLKDFYTNLKTILAHTIESFFYYLDILKDAVVLYLFYVALGDEKDLDNFREQLLLGLLVTTILPIVINGLYISFYHSCFIFKEESTRWYHRAVCIFLFPLLPGFIIFRKNEISTDIETLIELTVSKCKKRETSMTSLTKEIQQVHSYLAKKKLLENLILEIKTVEISLENTIQSSLQLVFAFLTLSKTQAEPPFTVFAGGQEKQLLYLSSAWAILKHALVCIKAEVGQKYVKLASKVLLGVKGLLFSTARIIAIVVFFTPLLGLFDVLAHWKREQIPFSQFYFPNNIPYTIGADLSYLNFNLIERGNYSMQKRPDASLYSGNRNMWILFLGFVYCAGLVFLFVVKMWSSTKFNKEVKNGKLSKPIIHIFGMMNMSLLYSDFDEENKVIPDMNCKLRKDMKEAGFMILLHTVMNIMLLCPLWFTTCKIKERHELIAKVLVWTFEDEETALWGSTFFSILLPIVFLVSGVLQFFCYCYNNKYCHPYRLLSEYVEDRRQKKEVIPLPEITLQHPMLHQSNIERPPNPIPYPQPTTQTTPERIPLLPLSPLTQTTASSLTQTKTTPPSVTQTTPSSLTQTTPSSITQTTPSSLTQTTPSSLTQTKTTPPSLTQTTPQSLSQTTPRTQTTPLSPTQTPPPSPHLVMPPQHEELSRK